MDAIMLLLHLLQQRSQIVIYSDKWHCRFFLMDLKIAEIKWQLNSRYLMDTLAIIGLWGLFG